MHTAICFYFYGGNKSDFVRLRTDSRNNETHNDMFKCWILMTYMLCFSMAMNCALLFSSSIGFHEIYTGALRHNKTCSVQIFYLHFNREKIRKFKVTKGVISSSKSNKER